MFVTSIDGAVMSMRKAEDWDAQERKRSNCCRCDSVARLGSCEIEFGGIFVAFILSFANCIYIVDIV